LQRSTKSFERKYLSLPPIKKDLVLQLQRVRQGSKSVEEFYSEMEMLLIKSDLEESVEATMIGFLNGLNQDIQDVVELQQHESNSNNMKIWRIFLTKL